MVPRSASNVRNPWTGNPSSVRWVPVFLSAFLETTSFSTGDERLSPAPLGSSSWYRRGASCQYRFKYISKLPFKIVPLSLGQIPVTVVPHQWKDDPGKLRQKDTDARWFRKNGVNHYGYKYHVSVDRENRLITNWDVTSAKVHDSRVLGELLAPSPRGDPQVFADSAHRSKETVAGLRKRGYKPRINFKGYGGKPLTPRQTALNHSHSRIRCRVEHVFGAIGNGMNARHMNCIGLKRSRVWIGPVNLCYYMKRFDYLVRAEAA